MNALCLEEYLVIIRDNYEPNTQRNVTVWNNSAQEAHSAVCKTINLNKEYISSISNKDGKVVFDNSIGFCE